MCIRDSIVAYPDGHCLTGKGVDGITSGKYTGNAPVGNTFAFNTFLCAFQISVYFIFLCVGGKLLYQFAFGSQYHEGDEMCIRDRNITIGPNGLSKRCSTATTATTNSRHAQMCIRDRS